MLDGLKIRQPPLQCLHETTDFLESSDPFYQWFSNTFTLTKERVDSIIEECRKNAASNN